MSGNEQLMFMALARGASLQDAITMAGLTEDEQRRLLPNMLAAAEVLKYRSEMARGFGATPEMLHLFREVTAPIVEAFNGQVDEIAQLRECVDRGTNANKRLVGAVEELLAQIHGVDDEEEKPPLRVVHADVGDGRGDAVVAFIGRMSAAPAPEGGTASSPE